MTAPGSPPLHVLAAASPDLLRAMIKTFADALMSAEADARHQRTAAAVAGTAPHPWLPGLLRQHRGEQRRGDEEPFTRPCRSAAASTSPSLRTTRQPPVSRSVGAVCRHPPLSRVRWVIMAWTGLWGSASPLGRSTMPGRHGIGSRPVQQSNPRPLTWGCRVLVFRPGLSISGLIRVKEDPSLGRSRHYRSTMGYKWRGSSHCLVLLSRPLTFRTS